MRKSIPWWAYILALAPYCVAAFIGKMHARVWFRSSQYWLGKMDKKQFEETMKYLSAMGKYDDEDKT